MLLYFRGCTAREKLNSISKATERILRAAKINYETLEDEQCCGSVLLRTGFVDDAIEQMNSNLEDFEGRTILTSCAGCYKTLKEDYKEHLGVDLKVMHISQLLEQLIKENKIKIDDKLISESGKLDKFNAEASLFDLIPRRDHVELHALYAVFLELRFNERHGQPRSVYGHVEFIQNIRRSADMIFMAVCDHECF